MDTVVVCLAADNAFAMPLAVTLESLLASRRDDRPFDVYVLDGGILPWNRRRILATAARHANATVRLVSMRDGDFDEMTNRFYPEATFFRLEIPTRLPRHIHKVIYLDSDTVVRGDLGELFDEPMDGYAARAVIDVWHGTLLRSRQLGPYLPALGIDNDTPYFNTGVLVMDVERFRDLGVSEACRKLATEYDLRYADQDALNIVLAGKIGMMDPRWNQQHTFHEMPEGWMYQTDGLPDNPEDLAAVRQEPHVVHFTGEKPWWASADPKHQALFFEVLDRTPWQGWRPTHLRRAVARAEKLVGTWLRPVLEAP